MFPLTLALLTKEAHRRIPRAVVASIHPAPVWFFLQQRPDGNAESAREMRRHRVDRDHQIDWKSMLRTVYVSQAKMYALSFE